MGCDTKETYTSRSVIIDFDIYEKEQLVELKNERYVFRNLNPALRIEAL